MEQNRQIKAVILAAGSRSLSEDGRPVFLEDLGDQKVIDSVLSNARQLTEPDDIYVVVGYHQKEVRGYLGDRYHLVVQEQPLGTGNAVLCLRSELQDFSGDLLILYADTPLYHPNSIRGLVNRHLLTGARLTMLTAITERPYPYGRVVRDKSGRIIDIIEEAQASASVKEITELNVGAYLVSTADLWPELQSLQPSPGDGEYRLTDLVHQMIRRGLAVESYQIYDEDEIQGINTREDLEQARFILQKRYLKPRREEEYNQVRFGTGGWRAVIGEGFTIHNVRRLCQALANDIIRSKRERRGVLIGYDRRFLSDRAAVAAAEVFAGNNIHVVLLNGDGPTPLIEYATRSVQAAYGLAFTASHNPPDWNGVKVFHGSGALLMTDETDRIEAETNTLTLRDVVKVPLDIAEQAGIVELRDFTNAYVDAVESFIDLPAIRAAGLRVIVDPMYGVGHLTLAIILNEARCRVTFIHDRHNPSFGGRSPAPNNDALRVLQAYVRDENSNLGLATDGDADRIAVVDERGRYIHINDILLLLYWYLHEVKGQRGGVVRNLATTHMLDRIAERFGEPCIETPVGFKWIAAAMQEHSALLGGESSGGVTVRGHILGKDGIFAAALIVEMLAKMQKPISVLLEHAWAITGRMYTVEDGVAATAEMRIIVPERLRALVRAGSTPLPVSRTREDDGIKLYFENGAWAILRFSGTEPVLRFFAEADTAQQAQSLVDWLKQCAQ